MSAGRRRGEPGFYHGYIVKCHERIDFGIIGVPLGQAWTRQSATRQIGVSGCGELGPDSPMHKIRGRFDDVIGADLSMNLDGHETIGITGGASTPDWLIEAVARRVNNGALPEGFEVNHPDEKMMAKFFGDSPNLGGKGLAA